MWTTSAAMRKKQNKSCKKSKSRRQRRSNPRQSAAAAAGRVSEGGVYTSSYDMTFSSDGDDLPNDVDEDYVCNVLQQQLLQREDDSSSSSSSQNGAGPSTAPALPEATNQDAIPNRGLDKTAEDGPSSSVDCRADRTDEPDRQCNPFGNSASATRMSSQHGRASLKASSDCQKRGQLKQQQQQDEDDTGSSDSEAYASPVISHAEVSRHVDAHFRNHAEEDRQGCGIPGVIPWWDEAGAADDSPETESDARFRSILTGSFGHLSQRSRTELISRLLLHARPSKDDEKLSLDPSRGHRCNSTKSTSSQRSRKAVRQAKLERRREKRQQKQLQQQAASSGPLSAAPVPDDNVGSLLLKKLGWSPGTGLGASRDGILAPITVSLRPGRTGLGYEHSATGVYRAPRVDAAADERATAAISGGSPT